MRFRLAIIGAGPVGLGLSLFLAKRGFEVDIFEKGTLPRDKACGQGIMPTGQKILNDLGVEFEAHEKYNFTGIQYFSDRLSVQGKLPHFGVGIERKVLSEKLYEKVSTHPRIHLHQNTGVSAVSHQNHLAYLTINNEIHEYHTVFVCDGLNSRVSSLLGNQVNRKGSLRQGARVHFNQAPWSENVEVYWADGIEAYVTPVSPHKTEVAFLWEKDKFIKDQISVDSFLSKFPYLSLKINRGSACSDFRGSLVFEKMSLDERVGPFFFVGDSFRFLDGITGEGISLGLWQASYMAKYFDQWRPVNRLHYFVRAWHYEFMVKTALMLTKSKSFRHMIFKIVRRHFSFFLKLNDL